VVIGLASPWPVVGELAVLAMALLGGAALLRSGVVVDDYVGDLERVARGDPVAPWLRVEVESRVELERSVFVGARRSPNVRRPGVDTPRPVVPTRRPGETP
jgi:hypothetical protein